jgi:prefoldin subunit 5
MKNIVCAFVLTLLLNSFYSQNTNITSLNSDRKVNIGLNLGDILRTSGPNNYRKSFDLVELNARYMINNRVGIKFDIAYDKFEFPRSKTSLTRISIQPVISLKELLLLDDISDKFNVLIHVGGGYSILKNRDEKGSPGDNMLNTILGFTPIYKINDRLSFNIDGSIIWNIMENKGFDWSSTPTHYYGSMTLGLSYTLGKYVKVKNLSFVSKRNTTSIDSLENDMKILEDSEEEMKTKIDNLNQINIDLKNKIDELETKLFEDTEKIKLIQVSIDSFRIRENQKDEMIPVKGYYIVVGSYKNLNNAENMKNKFIANGYRNTIILRKTKIVDNLILTIYNVAIFYSRNKAEVNSEFNKSLVLEPKAWIMEIK